MLMLISLHQTVQVYIGQPLALSRNWWVSQGLSGACQLGTALGIINKHRQDAGLPPLTLEELADIATTININNPRAISKFRW